MGKVEREQPSLWSVNSDFKNPGILKNIQESPQIVDIASSRAVWRQKEFSEKSKGRYYDLRNFKDITFTIRDWHLVPNISGNFDAAILMCNPLDEGNIKSVQSAANETFKKLRKESPLLIFEEKGGNFPKDRKLLLLEDAGLVERNVLTTISRNFNLIEGRKDRPRKPIDLLSEEKYPRSYRQLRDYWLEMVQMYREKGFVIVDPKSSPIIEKLHSSTYPPGDKQKLKDGFGVRVRSVHCGCTYDVNMKGEFNSVWMCSTHHEEDKYPDR